jgi:DNA-binding transcriptional ArsR family regulator
MVELAVRGTTSMEIESVDQLVDRIATLLDAFGHPVRLRIMAWAYSHPGEKVSAKRQSDVWGLPLGRVAYHVRKLHDTKLLYAAGTARRRGAIEHFYRLSPRGKALMEGAAGLVEGDEAQA